MTSDRLLTRPSLTPKMTARSVPDRALARCHGSRRPMSAAEVTPRARRGRRADGATPTPSDRPRRGARRQPLPDLCVLPLVGGDGRDLGRRALALVRVFLVALERLHEVGDRAGPEQPSDEHDEADPRPRAIGGRNGRPELGQLARPDVGVPPLVRRDPAEGGRPGRVLLDPRERVVQDDRVAFQLEVLEACREVDGRHAGHRTRVRRPATRAGRTAATGVPAHDRRSRP